MRGSWKDWIAILMSMTAGLVMLIIVDRPGSPRWLRAIAGVIIFAAAAAPLLFWLALIPWHFLALHRGLIRRGRVPCVVSLPQGVISVQRGDELTSHALDAIVCARFARNDNWTESKLLEDALGLFAASGREIERLPQSTTGLDKLLVELRARGIPIEETYVSAPAVFD